MAPAVICDAGPLIALACVDELELLRELFGTVLLPPAVRDERLAGRGADVERIRQALGEGRLRIASLRKPAAERSPSLGKGETEAIWLALETDDALLVVDDRLARRYALARGIRIVGTVRLLDMAERRGLIRDAEPLIRRMSASGYRISPGLLAAVRSEPR